MKAFSLLAPINASEREGERERHRQTDRQTDGGERGENSSHVNVLIAY